MISNLQQLNAGTNIGDAQIGAIGLQTFVFDASHGTSKGTRLDD